MIILGLTGSIGMGKSTIANMMKSLGIPVHDSDQEVHNLLAYDIDVRRGLKTLFPPKKHKAVYKGGTINRKELGKLIFNDAQNKHKLESLLHPRVRAGQANFIKTQHLSGRKIIALDIPLLFETGADAHVDATITVSAPHNIQRSRVMARPNMSEQKFAAILESQMPDGEKRARSDFVIETGAGRAFSMQQLRKIIATIVQQNESLTGRGVYKCAAKKYYLYGS